MSDDRSQKQHGQADEEDVELTKDVGVMGWHRCYPRHADRLPFLQRNRFVDLTQVKRKRRAIKELADMLGELKSGQHGNRCPCSLARPVKFGERDDSSDNREHPKSAEEID